MKSFKEFLTEISFDKTVDYEITDLPRVNHYDAKFEIEGKKVVVNFKNFGDGVWGSEFRTEGRLDLVDFENQSSVYTLFGTVIKIIKEFINEKQPEELSFSASKKDSIARSNVYKRIINRMEIEGYKVDTLESSEKAIFQIKRIENDN